MSFSIQARGKTKDEAVAAIAKEFDDVVLSRQPYHVVDKERALSLAQANINALRDGGGRDVVVVLSGSMAWNNAEQQQDVDKMNFTSFTLGCSAYYDWSQQPTS